MSVAHVLHAIDRTLGIVEPVHADPDRPRRKVVCAGGPRLHTCLGCGTKRSCEDFYAQRDRHRRKCSECERDQWQYHAARKVLAEMKRGVVRKHYATNNPYLVALRAGEPLGLPKRTCVKCHQLKSLDHFYPDPDGRLGVRADCADCVKARVRCAKERDRRASTKPPASAFDVSGTSSFRALVLEDCG